MNVYDSTLNAEEEDNIEIYEKLEELYERIPKNDILIVLGDFNAKRTIAEINREVAGKETIHNTEKQRKITM